MSAYCVITPPNIERFYYPGLLFAHALAHVTPVRPPQLTLLIMKEGWREGRKKSC